MKKTILNNDILSRANAIRRDKICNSKQAVNTATIVEELIERMLGEVVTFRYIRQDGKTETVNGTLTNYRKYFKREYCHQPDNIFVLYFDNDKQLWRTFHAANAI